MDSLPAPLLVSAADLVRIYGEGQATVRALDGVTVGFPKSRFTAIMGASGSGKSTLMHILAGLDRPTSGSVVLDGVELTTLDDRRLTELRRERVGFVFQSFNLLPVLDARENIVLPLSIAGKRPLDLLRRSVDDFGQTVIMVTHDPVAASYADRLLVLADGQIVHDGEARTSDAVLDLMKAVG
jgi:putative ABC transport system ATP-binding protein